MNENYKVVLNSIGLLSALFGFEFTFSAAYLFTFIRFGEVSDAVQLYHCKSQVIIH